MSFDNYKFRKCMSNFTTGIAIVTFDDQSCKTHGITINSLSSVSLNPPLILFCLHKDSFKRQFFYNGSNFAVNILNQYQESVARAFAKHDDIELQQEKNLYHKNNANSIPVLHDVTSYMICKTYDIYPGGDHDIIVASVSDLDYNMDKQPLLYFQSKYFMGKFEIDKPK